MEKKQSGKGNRDCTWRTGGESSFSSLLFQNRTLSPSRSRSCLVCLQDASHRHKHRACCDGQEGKTRELLRPAVHAAVSPPDPQARQAIPPPSRRRRCQASQRNVCPTLPPWRGVEILTQKRENREIQIPPRYWHPPPHVCFRGRGRLEESFHCGPEREIWWRSREEDGRHHSNLPLPILVRKKKNQGHRCGSWLPRPRDTGFRWSD